VVSPTSATHHPSKKRQYAPGETQAYYGASGTTGYDGGYGVGQANPQGEQLFTPGFAQPDQFAMQQAQAVGGAQPGYYGQQQPQYINGPDRGAGYGPAVGQLTEKFGQMGVAGQAPFQLVTTNLLTTPPDAHDLLRPPPPIILPPGASLSPSPTANADPSYMRSTVNAFPTTSSLASKSKIPLALIITPYRSVPEGDTHLPLVTDTVIARCRRCRTYINPYVTFIDGGNRYVSVSMQAVVF
jgi:protein transport protein SEC24